MKTEPLAMLMMTPDGRVTEWNELPLILGPEDLALLLNGSLGLRDLLDAVNKLPEF